MMKRFIKLALCALLSGILMISGCMAALAEPAAQSAERSDNEWYMDVLGDNTLMSRYPYYAFADVNENEDFLLFISTTSQSFITDEDSGLVFAGINGVPVQLMAFGGKAGESFYCNLALHTLTYFTRASGEMHIQVYTLSDGMLIPVTSADTYSPFHAPDGNNAESVYLQDGNAITEQQSDTLWQTYADESDIMVFDEQVFASTASDSLPTYRTLSVGDRGQDVRSLQERLNALGYNCGNADGVFGSSTKMAVIEFQELAGLSRQDGVATAEVQGRIFSKNAPRFTRSFVEEEDDRDDYASISLREVQQRLRDLGYTDAPVNGKNDSRFKSALRTFQSAAGLKADGVLGSGTIKALMAKRAPYNNDYIPLRRGDYGSHVASVQRKLQELGLFPYGVDGEYGGHTARAVATFKAYMYIGGSGNELDVNTIIILMNMDPVTFSGYVDEDIVIDEEIPWEEEVIEDDDDDIEEDTGTPRDIEDDEDADTVDDNDDDKAIEDVNDRNDGVDDDNDRDDDIEDDRDDGINDDNDNDRDDINDNDSDFEDDRDADDGMDTGSGDFDTGSDDFDTGTDDMDMDMSND